MTALKEKQLPSNAVTLWRIRATLILVAASFLCGVLFVFSSVVAVIFGIAVLLLYGVNMLLYFPMFYKGYVYDFTPDFIFIRKGILFKKEIRIQTDRIQYCVLIQGPLQRLFRLTSVLILTAGSREFIRDITVKEAECLRRIAVKSGRD